WSAIEGGFWMEHFGFDVVGNPDSELANWNARDRYYAISRGIDHRDLKKQLDKNKASINGRARGIRRAVASRLQKQPLPALRSGTSPLNGMAGEFRSSE